MDLGTALIIVAISFLFGVLAQAGFAIRCINSIEKKLDILEKILYQLTEKLLVDEKTQSEDCEESDINLKS